MSLQLKIKLYLYDNDYLLRMGRWVRYLHVSCDVWDYAESVNIGVMQYKYLKTFISENKLYYIIQFPYNIHMQHTYGLS